MSYRFTARPGDRRHPRLGRRRRNGRPVPWLVAFAVSVGLILAGFQLAHGSTGSLRISADVQGASGWGRGGYPMMPGSGTAGVLQQPGAAG